MSELSSEIAVTSRKMDSLIFQRISAKTQTAIALSLNISEATVCRYMGTSEDIGMISKITNLLEVLDLQIATKSVVVADAKTIRATEQLACQYLQQKMIDSEEKERVILSLEKEILKLKTELSVYKKSA